MLSMCCITGPTLKRLSSVLGEGLCHEGVVMVDGSVLGVKGESLFFPLEPRLSDLVLGPGAATHSVTVTE